MRISYMKALVYEGPGELSFLEQPVPVIKEDEVLIQVRHVGICGSELGGYQGKNSLRKPPLIMGHEFSGFVYEIGSKITSVQKGDRVTVNPLLSCNRCTYCQTGRAHLCTKRELIGAHRPGAFAEFVVVPEENIYKLPENVSLEEGALVEPIACAVHICRTLNLSPEHHMYIAGAGPIGLFTLQIAQFFGLENIVISDVNSERLKIAEKLGGVAINGDIEEWKTMNLSEGFDVSVDAVGLEETRKNCIQLVKAGGNVVFSGLHTNENTIPINNLIRDEIHISGAFAYSPYDFEFAIDWISKGKNNLMPWIIQNPLVNGRDSFEKLINNPGNIAKILLDV